MEKTAEWFVVGRACARVLADSERTSEIHKVEELTGRRLFRTLVGEPSYAALLRDRPELCSDQVDYEALRALPPDTLGGRYVRHLDDNGLSAESQAAPTRYVDDPQVAYLMRRYRQTHDVWHALVELGTAGYEEVLLHAFSWGQLRLPVSALVVIFGSVKHMIMERRWTALRRGLRAAHRSGRDAAPLLPVHWERAWGEPIDDVRRRYRIESFGRF